MRRSAKISASSRRERWGRWGSVPSPASAFGPAASKNPLPEPVDTAATFPDVCRPPMPLILLLAPVALPAAPAQAPTTVGEGRASPATGGARSAEHRIAPRAQALVAALPPAPPPPLAEGPPLSLAE